jgi:hypothetical protein
MSTQKSTSRYPLLEALRAQRMREEAEIAAPYRAETIRANMLAVQEREARAGLENLIRNELLPHILRDVGHKLADGVDREIMKAIGQQRGFSGVTKLELPTDMLLMADPKSIVARVVEWWRRDVAPRMEVRGVADVKRRATILDIRLPSMVYRERVIEDL